MSFHIIGVPMFITPIYQVRYSIVNNLQYLYTIFHINKTEEGLLRFGFYTILTWYQRMKNWMLKEKRQPPESIPTSTVNQMQTFFDQYHTKSYDAMKYELLKASIVSLSDMYQTSTR